MEKDIQNTILRIKNLEIGFASPFDKNVVKGVSLSLAKSKITALVGESGSGKSLTALSILGFTKLIDNSFVKGEILFHDDEKVIDLLNLSEVDFEKLRGSKIAMIFQDPYTSFNPIKKCGEQIVEIIMLHQKFNRKVALTKTLELFSQMGVEDRIFNSFLHQISGGQLQRVGIAIALASNPKLLIADEPTTNLDSSLKRELLDLLLKIKRENGISILYISHDLDAVKYIANDVVLMHRGEIIEYQNNTDFFNSPKNEYTKNLNSIFFNFDIKLPNKVVEKEENILEIINLKKYFSTNSLFSFLFKNKAIQALKNINFSLGKGEILGVVGESGSGKSTLARVIMKLIDFDNGKISYQGKNIKHLDKSELEKYRKEVQIVFQNPLSSLNPVIKIKSLLAEPLDVYRLYKNKLDKDQKIKNLVKSVGLDESILDKYPDQISGGEGQRIAIARAIAIQPKLLILDESISSLDKFAQRDILDLLLKLRKEFKLTYIFITHDLKLSKYFCNRILILKEGEIVDIGNTNDIFNNPTSQYTKNLLNAVL